MVGCVPGEHAPLRSAKHDTCAEIIQWDWGPAARHHSRSRVAPRASARTRPAKTAVVQFHTAWRPCSCSNFVELRQLVPQSSKSVSIGARQIVLRGWFGSKSSPTTEATLSIQLGLHHGQRVPYKCLYFLSQVIIAKRRVAAAVYFPARPSERGRTAPWSCCTSRTVPPIMVINVDVQIVRLGSAACSTKQDTCAMAWTSHDAHASSFSNGGPACRCRAAQVVGAFRPRSGAFCRRILAPPPFLLGHLGPRSHAAFGKLDRSRGSCSGYIAWPGAAAGRRRRRS